MKLKYQEQKGLACILLDRRERKKKKVNQQQTTTLSHQEEKDASTHLTAQQKSIFFHREVLLMLSKMRKCLPHIDAYVAHATNFLKIINIQSMSKDKNTF